MFTALLPGFHAAVFRHHHRANPDSHWRPDRLTDLWAEDGVAFFPGSPPAVGKQAIGAEEEKFHAQYPGFKVLSYTSKYKNLQVENGLACEWFEKKDEYKLSPESPSASWHAKGLVVLKRQSDGSWKGEYAASE